jgi:hypothetical protein
MRLAEMADKIKVSIATLHRWSSDDPSCDCSWHKWSALKLLDSDENHSRALGLRGSGHNVEQISIGLGVPLDIVQSWGDKNYPCMCGSHGWLTGLTEIVVAEKLSLPSLVVISDSGTINSSHTTALITVLDSLSQAVQKGEVALRSWRDVLDTLKICSEVIEKLGSLPNDKKPSVARIKESRTVEFPMKEGTSADLTRKASSLSEELMATARDFRESKR